MIAVDTNILVYAHRTDAPQHLAARKALESLAADHLWGLPWPAAVEYLAVVTSPARFADPTPLEVALAQIEALARTPSAVVLVEAADALTPFAQLVRSSHATSRTIYDARIAALCLSHGVRELWTADRDFARFPKLRTRNPLVG